MSHAGNLVSNWIKEATRDALVNKLAEIDPSKDRGFSPRDAEARTQLRAMIRKEIGHRDSTR